MKGILVAYNRNWFDIPFLINAWERVNIKPPYCIHYYYWDPCQSIINHNFKAVPQNKSLSVIYKYITGKDLGLEAHLADVGVSALFYLFYGSQFGIKGINVFILFIVIN